MSTDVVSLIQAIVEDVLHGYRTAELGVVTSVYSHASGSDKNNYECDVKLRDSGVELKKVALTTQRVGAVAIPNVDELVLVQFLNGDIHSAVVTGRLYHDQTRSPEAKDRELIYISPDAAESGVRRVYLELPNNNKLTVDDDKLQLEMGKTTLTINNDAEVEVKSNNKDITISDQSGDNSLEIKVQQGQVNIKGKTKVVVDAQQIELVDGASHALVLGDELLQYLQQVVQMYQSHMHPGELAMGVFPVSPAPPVPPLPPPTPSLLSLKVKTN